MKSSTLCVAMEYGTIWTTSLFDTHSSLSRVKDKVSSLITRKMTVSALEKSHTDVTYLMSRADNPQGAIVKCWRYQGTLPMTGAYDK